MRTLPLLLVSLIPAVAVAGDPKPEAKPPAPKPMPPKDSKAPAPTPTPTPPAGPVKPAVVTAPAEVAQTVGAFKGNWSFDATLNAPGMPKPATFKMTFNCKPIALGNAVSCESKAKTPMGPYEGTFLIGYDPFSKAVHFISVTSELEIHDHVCQWDQGMAGKFGLGCTPLKAGTGADGKEITEDLMIAFHNDGKETEFTSTSHLKSGGDIVFSGKGKKK